MLKLKQIYLSSRINKNTTNIGFSCIKGFKIEQRVWDFQFRCPWEVFRFYKTDLNPEPEVQFLSVTRRAESDLKKSLGKGMEEKKWFVWDWRRRLRHLWRHRRHSRRHCRRRRLRDPDLGEVLPGVLQVALHVLADDGHVAEAVDVVPLDAVLDEETGQLLTMVTRNHCFKCFIRQYSFFSFSLCVCEWVCVYVCVCGSLCIIFFLSLTLSNTLLSLSLSFSSKYFFSLSQLFSISFLSLSLSLSCLLMERSVFFEVLHKWKKRTKRSLNSNLELLEHGMHHFATLPLNGTIRSKTHRGGLDGHAGLATFGTIGLGKTDPGKENRIL